MSSITVNRDLAPRLALASGSLAGRFANTIGLFDAWASACDGEEARDVALRDSLRHASEQLAEAARALAGIGGLRLPDGALNTGEHGIYSSEKNGLFSLRGRCELVSLVEFVGFVSSLRRNGVLQIQSSSEEFVLQIEDECIMFATGQNPLGLRLRQILITRGAVEPAELDRALKECRPDEYLGETLIRLNIVDMPMLVDALTHQVTVMFCRMHMIGTGFKFQFEEDTKVLIDPDIRLSVPELLQESATLMDQAGTLLAEMAEE